VKVLDRERGRIVKRQPPKLRRHGEGDLDEIVEVGITGDVAQATNIMRLQRAQGAKAIEYHAGLRTDDVPTHFKQPASRCVEKQVDAFRLCDGAVAREGQRIDAVEGEVVAAADQRFEFGDDTRAPGPRLLDLGHLAFEEPFLNVGHGAPRQRELSLQHPGLYWPCPALPRQVRLRDRRITSV
jgi:hypothetical protein